MAQLSVKAVALRSLLSGFAIGSAALLAIGIKS